MKRDRRATLGALFVLATTTAAAAAAPRAVRADSLASDSEIESNGNGSGYGYIAIDELSHEAIVAAHPGKAPELQLRSALHNASAQTRDAVAHWALPPGSEIVGLRVRTGTDDWRDSLVAAAMKPGEPNLGDREPSTVYVRRAAPVGPGALPSAEIVVRGLEAGSTLQVEVRVAIRPQLRAQRWQLVLPSRQITSPNLADRRRVLVQGLAEGQSFSVDGLENGQAPAIETRSNDAVVVTWPARVDALRSLKLESSLQPARENQPGRISLGIRLGSSSGRQPDHVAFVVDRSSSTAPEFRGDAARAIRATLETLPNRVSYDIVSFARQAAPIDELAKRRVFATDADRLQARLERVRELPRIQGSDVGRGLELALEHAGKIGARRPLLVVLTDGMLPETLQLDELRGKLDAAATKGGKPVRHDIVFIVDDPRLAELGITNEHAAARICAALGARVTQSRLATWPVIDRQQRLAQLLHAPKVLDGLRITSSAPIQWTQSLPQGLVAGSHLQLEGAFEGKTRPKITVRGRVGKKTIRRSTTPRVTTHLRSAHVASPVPGLVERAAKESFSYPDWLKPEMRRRAKLSIIAAARIGRPITGHLDRRTVQRYLRTRVLPRARACYNRALIDHQTQSGRVVLQFEVGKGEVMLARVAEHQLAFADDDLLACLLDAAWQLELPAGHKDARHYRLTYPLTLTPPSDGRPPRTRAAHDPIFDELMRGPGPSAGQKPTAD